MKRLLSQIKRELNLGEWKHCAVYERELKRFWPLNQKNRKAKIAQFAIRPRADKHGFDLSSDAIPYSPLWYRGSNAFVDAVGYAKSYSRLHPVVIRVYDATRNVIETLEYKHDLKRAVSERNKKPPCSEA